MSIRMCLGGAVLLLFLSACQAFRGPDVQATLQAEGAAYVSEATAIAQTAQAQATFIQATVDAAETQIAETNSISQQLLATARVLVPPTPQRIVGNAPDASGVAMPDMSGGSSVGTTIFTNTGVTASVRESDGCPNGFQNQFLTSAERIYVTTQASSISGGTVMGVEWRYDGQVVFSDDWTVSQDSSNFCLWYFITSDDVAFQSGNWSVQLFADGSAIEPSVSFEMVEG